MFRNSGLGSLSVGVSLIAILSGPAIAGDVAGKVLDGTNTVALQSAEVRLVELDRATVTDDAGSFVFGDVPAGRYTLEARFVGRPTQQVMVDVPETGRVVANLALGSAGDEILVIGQSANLANALSRKKAADGVSDVLTRDAIGQFPDQNVAESLRRLPGVNVLNDQGEGRFVAVRGLDPDLNATSLNGVRLPSPESDVRAVALDVVSSDMVESIEVKKSLTPDMDADTIGASIEINTVSPFKRRKNLYSADIEGSWNKYSGKVTPKGSFDFAARLGERFGLSGGVSFYKREFETDNVEAAPWSTSDDGVVYNEELEYRDYDVTRKRLNFSLGLDVLLSPSTTAYAKGNWSQFDDHEYRRRTAFLFDEQPASGDSDSAQFSDADGRIEIRRDLKDRFERQRIRSYVIGSDTDTGDWTVKWSGSYAKSTEREDFSLDPARFRARFNDDGVDIGFDYSDLRVPAYSILSGADLVNDPSNYAFNRIELTDLSDSSDREWALKGDVARHFGMEGGELTLQAGAKARWRDKRYDFNLLYYGDVEGDFTLADVLGEQTYRLIDMGPVASKGGPADFFLDHRGDFEIDEYETALGSASSDYAVSEDVMAGYALARWDSTKLRAIGGLRVERTRNRLDGNLVADDGDEVTVSPVTFSKRYTDWLPSLTLRYTPTDRLVLRLAGSKSLVRPKLAKLAPRFTINEDDEAEFGNPDLEPYRSWNLDAAAEYYIAGTGALTLGAFYKKIDNFIVDGFFDEDDAPYNGTYRGVDFSEALIPLNGDAARVAGIEAGYSQKLSMLPAPFDGLLVQGNYTYTWSKGRLFDGREIPLPASSRNTFNLTLGYEKGPIEFRAAGTYRSKYLDELGAGSDTDRYVDNHFQIDLSAKYRVTQNVRLFAEWINVNNAKYFAYHNYAGRQRLLQYEEYGPTVKFGAKVTL